MQRALSSVSTLLLVAVLLVATPAHSGPQMSAGQILLVPTYSRIAYGSGRSFLRLRVTLSLRNLSRTTAIEVRRVDFHDGTGALVTRHLESPISIAPLAGHEIQILDEEGQGKVSSSFIVEWSAEQPVVAPVVETVMVGTTGTQGFSFVSHARVLEEAGL